MQVCKTVSLTASESFSLEFSARQVIVYVKYGIRIAAVTYLECPSKSTIEINYNKLNECVIWVIQSQINGWYLKLRRTAWWSFVCSLTQKTTIHIVNDCKINHVRCEYATLYQNSRGSTICCKEFLKWMRSNLLKPLQVNSI